MHETRRVAARSQHTRHEVFLADVALVDVLDTDAGGLAHLLRTFAHAVAQRLGSDPNRCAKVPHQPTVRHA